MHSSEEVEIIPSRVNLYSGMHNVDAERERQFIAENRTDIRLENRTDSMTCDLASFSFFLFHQQVSSFLSSFFQTVY